MPKVSAQSHLGSSLCRIVGKVNPASVTLRWRLKSGGMWNGVMYTATTNSVTAAADGTFIIEAPPSASVGNLVIDFPNGRRAELVVPESGEVSLDQLDKDGMLRWV